MKRSALAFVTLAMVAVAASTWTQTSTDSIEAEGVRFGTGASIGAITEKMRITQGGLVGIGTQSPTATLQVSGSFVVSTSAQTTAPSLYVGTNGNVGIGTTNSLAKLTVNGTVSITDALQISGTTLTCTMPLAGAMRYTSGTVQVCNGTSWGNIGIGVPTGTIMAFATSSCPSGWTPYTPAYGRFLRGIDLTGSTATDPSGTRTAGGTQDDTLQNLTGTISGAQEYLYGSGVFSGNSAVSGNRPANGTSTERTLDFDASLVARTSTETRPKNVAVLYCQYAGYDSAIASGITSLDGLSDVTISGASNGQVLTYSGGTWVNGAAPAATAASSTGAIQFNSGASFAGDTSNLFWDDANNRLGVATALPSATLHIQGQGTFQSNVSNILMVGNNQDNDAYAGGTMMTIRNSGQSTLNKYLAFVSDYDGDDSGTVTFGGLGLGANNSFAINNPSGSAIALQTTGGNVGIGTTDPGEALEISKANGAGNVGLRLIHVGQVEYRIGINDTDDKLYITNNNGASAIGSNATGIVMTSAGKVGIGTNTPSNTLMVYGNTTYNPQINIVNDAADSSPGYLLLGKGRSGASSAMNDGLGNITFQGRNSSNALTNSSWIVASVENTPTAVVASKLQFLTTNEAGTATAKMVIRASGTVGIGTGNPLAKLDVAGTVSASDAVQVGSSSLTCSSGIRGAMRYETVSDTLQICTSVGWKSLTSTTVAAANVDGAGSANHIAYWSDADTLTYDSSQLYWDATNNRLGIGTSNPTKALEVVGQISATSNINSSWQGTVTASNTAPASTVGILGGQVNGAYWVGVAGRSSQPSNGVGVYGESGNATGFGGYFTNTSTGPSLVTGNGNVGIRTSTPSQMLTISGSSATPALVEVDTFGNTYGQFVAKQPGVGSGWFGLIGTGAGLGARNGTVEVGTSGSMDLTLLTNATERVRIDGSNGNVGIGTTSPGVKFDVNGVGRFGDITNGSVAAASDGNAYIEMREMDNAGTPYIDFSNDSSSDFDARIVLTGDDAVGVQGVVNFDVSGGNAAGVVIKANSTAASSNAAVQLVNPARNWSIGNNGATYGGALIVYDNTAAATRVLIDSAGDFGVGVTNPTYKIHASGQVAGAGAYVNTSDGRLKKDVNDLDYGLDTVMRLHPVSFRWKEQKEDWQKGRKLGLIAQEAEQVVPEVVSTANDDLGTKSIAYGDLTPVLIKAVQELKASNDNLISRTEALQMQLKAANDNSAILERRLKVMEGNVHARSR